MKLAFNSSMNLNFLTNSNMYLDKGDKEKDREREIEIIK